MISPEIAKIEENYKKDQDFKLRIGDTVKVLAKITEGNKTRIQIFQGTIISYKKANNRSNITVRKIVDGVGVEKIFLLHSPNIKDVQVIKAGKARRAKLYYLRERVGRKANRIKDKVE